eukprot:jgi/Chrzof1/575/Cz01g20290.t1
MYGLVALVCFRHCHKSPATVAPEPNCPSEAQEGDHGNKFTTAATQKQQQQQGPLQSSGPVIKPVPPWQQSGQPPPGMLPLSAIPPPPLQSTMPASKPRSADSSGDCPISVQQPGPAVVALTASPAVPNVTRLPLLPSGRPPLQALKPIPPNASGAMQRSALPVPTATPAAIPVNTVLPAAVSDAAPVCTGLHMSVANADHAAAKSMGAAPTMQQPSPAFPAAVVQKTAPALQPGHLQPLASTPPAAISVVQSAMHRLTNTVTAASNQ